MDQLRVPDWKVNPDSHRSGCLFPDFPTDVRKREHGWFLLQGNGEVTVPFSSSLLELYLDGARKV